MNKVGNGVMDTGTAYIYHNISYLVFGTSHGLSYAGGVYFSNFHFVNNIIVATRWTLDMPSASGDPSHNNTFNYDNLWTYNPASGYEGFQARWSSVPYYDLSDFQTGTNQELNGISADPKFIDPDNGDFHLQSDSPCINAGVELLGFNDANSPWPYNGSAPDIGRYESAPIDESDAPETYGHSPAKGASNISPDTSIVVHVTDNKTGDAGVNQSTIVMKVD
ncbi:unnamed protein product, partial [marine sediment metagenome]